ncbi:MAG: hypothetical protein CO012_03410 [Syntrophobacterales bacterium CG_4_8_14_3_um_filter_49_14]|nr:MAG: hypothetical protein COX52_11825 [Syntrophobacterales bacterium CG23_combo_of_CG06-09_8_20_14_all_48_27]PJA48450.1 MAG: hypothetical protein CO171_07325 [Syntrophobacterales bacterium CG_4_9_14_3_um_filter_49_8]PJC75390.1 MAG: hypothetical protein CO012_03410 [Syntrophobacterales bacterium CG_4_8_14_3_um_filter_49_14]
MAAYLQKSNRTILGFLLLLIIICLFVSCGKEEEGTKPPDKIAVDPANIEKVSPVMADDFYRSVGTVRSEKTAQIASKTMGYVLAVNVREGDKVKKGDLLLSLQSRELEFRLEAALNSILEIERGLAEAEAAKEEEKANLGLAEVTYQRFKGLMERKSISRQEFDEVKAKYEVAEARLRRAEEKIGSLKAKKSQIESSAEEAGTYLGYTRIKAPFSGTIIQKNVHEGDLTIPGNVLFVLEDHRNYRLEASADEAKTGKIKPGEEVGVTLDALGEEKIRGKVAEIVPQIDPATRTFQVKIALPFIPGIKSGMYGKAYFPAGKSFLLLVPRTALAECGQLSSLYIINRKGLAERRLVKTGKDYDDRVEVVSGLDPGESVVVRDLFKIREGCPVRQRP